jgi:hypothetical protein
MRANAIIRGGLAFQAELLALRKLGSLSCLIFPSVVVVQG